MSFPVEVLCHLGLHDGSDELRHALRLKIIARHGCIKAGLLVLTAYALPKLENFGPLIRRKRALALDQKQLIV